MDQIYKTLLICLTNQLPDEKFVETLANFISQPGSDSTVLKFLIQKFYFFYKFNPIYKKSLCLTLVHCLLIIKFNIIKNSHQNTIKVSSVLFFDAIKITLKCINNKDPLLDPIFKRSGKLELESIRQLINFEPKSIGQLINFERSKNLTIDWKTALLILTSYPYKDIYNQIENISKAGKIPNDSFCTLNILNSLHSMKMSNSNLFFQLIDFIFEESEGKTKLQEGFESSDFVNFEIWPKEISPEILKYFVSVPENTYLYK